MDPHFLIDNLTNPALLFFFLGILAITFPFNITLGMPIYMAVIEMTNRGVG